jgi:four helix bundle protein
MGDYRKLRVWEAAISLAVECYEATSDFPGTEKFGLTSQIRRAAISVSANIAEGSGRKTDRDFVRFLRIAGGSANEVESLLLVGEKLGYIEASTLETLMRRLVAVRRQLAGLERGLEAGDR